MIAYFDTSAVIPLIVAEPSSSTCNRVWNDASRVVSVRLLYPEARAALAKAQRMGRLTGPQLVAAVAELESIITEVDHIEVTAELAHAAGELAHRHGLRGYDAVHLAAAAAAADSDLVLATGDADLAVSATSLGIAVAITNA
ncbi:MAG: type II toxin-antitoxin system VapC family toxin [Acidimicrobiia bacterium]